MSEKHGTAPKACQAKLVWTMLAIDSADKYSANENRLTKVLGLFYRCIRAASYAATGNEND